MKATINLLTKQELKKLIKIIFPYITKFVQFTFRESTPQLVTVIFSDSKKDSYIFKLKDNFEVTLEYYNGELSPLSISNYNVFLAAIRTMVSSIELEVNTYLCTTKIFKINNIEASAYDFGEVVDTEPFDSEDADEYDERRWSCGNARFIINMDTWHVKRIMSEYKITREQYREIAEQLEEKLSFGSCGYCV